MTFSKEEAVKGLKEVTKMLEEGCEVDSSTLCMIEEFLEEVSSLLHGQEHVKFSSQALSADILLPSTGGPKIGCQGVQKVA